MAGIHEGSVNNLEVIRLHIKETVPTLIDQLQTSYIAINIVMSNSCRDRVSWSCSEPYEVITQPVHS